jgi:hypothetical protein
MRSSSAREPVVSISTKAKTVSVGGMNCKSY